MTTVHYIEKYLKDGDKILDIGAGAGEYSLYFARKGYEVLALELADANIAAFKKKLTPEDKIDLVQGNALDLSRYADKSFDIVLLFGPLYHLKNDAGKQKCISEAKRVCKDGGLGSWVNATGCTFRGNGVGLWLDNRGGATCSGSYYGDSVYEDNGTAVRIAAMPGTETLDFNNCVFRGNGVNVENAAGYAVDLPQIVTADN